MTVKAMAGLALAGVLLAACSSTSSKGSAAAGATAGTTAAGGSSAATDPSPAPSIPASQSTSPSFSASASGSDKPVALLLAKAKLPGAGGAGFDANMPKAEPQWIAAVAGVQSDGSALKSDPLGSLALNLAALVDEAAKTRDLDSLRALCHLGCDQLPTLMPAKDASGHTGYERLSQLLEKTHMAPGYTSSWSVDYPGFSANQHGAATKLDQQDMRLLGVSVRYSGLRTGIELVDDGQDPKIGWDAVLSANA